MLTVGAGVGTEVGAEVGTGGVGVFEGATVGEGVGGSVSPICTIAKLLFVAVKLISLPLMEAEPP